MSDLPSSPHAAGELILLIGEAARGARDLGHAIARLGYDTREAPSVAEIDGARPPVAIIVAARPGIDPFRTVRAVRTRSRFTHSLVFAWTPAGFDPPVGVAVAAGADDIVGERSTIEECVDRVVGRLARNRALHERATFDCMTHIRGRLFVSDWLSAEIGFAVENHLRASFAVVWLPGFAVARARAGLLAAERDVEAAAFALSAAVRPCDLPCRLSDDTFVVLVPGAAMLEAAAILEKARERISAKAESLRDVRIGLAEAPRDGVVWQELFERAEALLPATSIHARTSEASRPLSAAT